MAGSKSYTEILTDILKPRWVQVCDPVEGTPDATQTVDINHTTGALTFNVEGVSNRPIQDNYGIVKELALLASDHHYDDGMHHIADIDVIVNAGIQEVLGKLDLTFYGMDIPEESGVYTTTSELADKIAELYEYLAILRKGLGSHVASRLDIKYLIENELGLVGFLTDPNYFTSTSAMNRSNFKILEDYIEAWINGKKLNLRGTNIASDDGVCYIPLSSPSKSIISDPEADVIWLEIYSTELSTTYVPYGNLQYGVSGSYQIITPTNTYVWVDAIALGYHNMMINADQDPLTLPFVQQLQYNFATSTFDPSTSFYGIDVCTTLSGQSIVRSNVRGLWKAADDSCVVFPVAVIGKRNSGIYHKALNPAGTAVVRLGSITPSSLAECFEYIRIGYFDDSGLECDYLIEIYDASDDLYGDSTGIKYRRSGLSRTTKTSNPDGMFVDKVYTEDVAYIGKQATDDLDKMVADVSERILGTDLYTELSPIFSGVASTYVTGLAYGRRPTQVVGFGASETAMFGLDNNGGVFIDKTNDAYIGIVDNVRTYWADIKASVESVFRLTEGIHGSETKSYLTYEPTSQTVTINTTALSGPPLIASTTPVMLWQDGSTVTLTTSWTGLGTSSASCIINTTGHTGHVLYGVVYLEYGYGSGIPFVLDDIIKIEDMLGTEYDFCYEKTNGYCLGCMWSGSPTSGTTNSMVLPECIDCDSEDELVDGWIYILESSTIAGQSAQILSYDDTTRIVVLKTHLTGAISASDVISVGKLEPEEPIFIIIPYSRGLKGVYKRSRVQATASGIYISTLPITESTSGTIQGTIVTGLTALQYFEVIIREETPLTSGFYITFYHNPQFNQFKTLGSITKMNIVRPGIFVDTTKGSANEPYSLYRNFVPTSSTKEVDSTKWISTDCQTPYFTVNDLEYNRAFDIHPVENLDLVVSGTTIRTNKMVLDDYLSVLTDIAETEENYRLIMGTLLVNTSEGYKLLIALRHVGTFGFNITTNCFFVNMDVIF